MELADVVRQHGPAYLAKYGERLPLAHRRALDAILRCHTPACGGSVYACDHCGARHFAWHRCGHRACNQCGQSQAAAWKEAQTARLLPVDYFLVTFTVPAELRRIFRRNQRVCYDALFTQSAATLQDVARQRRYLDGDLGLLGVLHTWTRQLAYHPHIHYLVPGVALQGADGTLGFPGDPEFLLPVRRLSALFRGRLRAELRDKAPEVAAQIPARVWRQPWIVHSQKVGRGRQALEYLARYVARTALSSARLLRQDARTVTFSYRPSGANETRTLTLSGEEFLRRYLQHVLPSGWRRIRTYGWLSPAARARFERVRTLLAVSIAAPDAAAACAATVMLCAHCQQPMRRVGLIARCGRAPPLQAAPFVPDGS